MSERRGTIRVTIEPFGYPSEFDVSAGYVLDEALVFDCWRSLSFPTPGYGLMNMLVDNSVTIERTLMQRDRAVEMISKAIANHLYDSLEKKDQGQKPAKGAKMKETITLEDSPISAIVKLAQGNPGAATVLGEVMKQPTGILTLCHLDDLDIRGSLIWVAFKNYCKSDLAKFVELVDSRDDEMLRFVRAF